MSKDKRGNSPKRNIRAEGVPVRLFRETVVDLVKIGAELTAKDGHVKTYDDAVRFLIEMYRTKEAAAP